MVSKKKKFKNLIAEISSSMIANEDDKRLIEYLMNRVFIQIVETRIEEINLQTILLE